MSTPSYGDKRLRFKFLFFPSRINGKWYWLKDCKVVEEYQKDSYLDVSNYTDEIEGYCDGWIIISKEII